MMPGPVTGELGIPGLTPGGIGIWVGVSALIGRWIVQRVAYRKVESDEAVATRKISSDSDASLRADLMAMINKLEVQAIDERRDCDRRLAAMQAKLETMQEKMDGLIRQLLQYQVTTGHALPIALRSSEIDRALDRLDGIEAGKAP